MHREITAFGDRCLANDRAARDALGDVDAGVTREESSSFGSQRSLRAV